MSEKIYFPYVSFHFSFAIAQVLQIQERQAATEGRQMTVEK
jgi:hypothetical protein